MNRRPTLLLALLALAPLACQTTEDPGDRAPRLPPPERWTDAFREAAVLIADEIVIEGPPAIRNRFALPQDPTLFATEVRATDRGLLQIATARGGVEVRAQLDNWTIVAVKRIAVLELPDHAPVRIHARGNAFWKPVEPPEGDAPAERRGAELTFEGALLE